MKNKQKKPVIISKRNYLISYSKDSPLALMHLWHFSSFWVKYFAEPILKGVS